VEVPVLPKRFAKFSPFAKFWVSVLTVLIMAVAIPLGSPIWVPIAVAALNCIGVFFTPNFEPAPLPSE
jgi:hypothetical protein